MSRKSNIVNNFADLMSLQGIQEMHCWNQAEEDRAKLAETPIGDTDGDRNISCQVEVCYQQQTPRRPVSKEEREYLRSLWGFKRR